MRHHRRHNPLGINAATLQDGLFVAGGTVGSAYIAGFLKQSGWMDVGATALAAGVLGYVGHAIDGQHTADELLKGGLALAILKAVKQLGFTPPGLSGYVRSDFTAPTASDAYGRFQWPVAALPAPAAGAKTAGMGYGGFPQQGRYRSRFYARF